MTINGIPVDIVQKDIKNLHLAVYPPDGRVRVAAPQRTGNEAIRLFVISRISWIKKRQRQFKEQERQSEREFISGENHYFRGTRYLLRVKYHSAPAKVEISNKKYIDLYVRENSSKDYKHKAVFNWYRKELRKQLSKLVEKWEKKTNIEVKDWRIRRMKTKWGTCNRNAKRIRLNLELAKKPHHSLEYILVHEMVHILEEHHTDIFREYMTKFMPKWKFYREELNHLILNHEKWED